MKNSLVLVAAIIALAVIIVMGLRYELIVNSPIVAKMDRLTGEVWVANSGMWLKINDMPKENLTPPPAAPENPNPAEKAK